MRTKSIGILICYIFFVMSCDEPKEADTTLPEIVITAPQDGSIVSGIVTITYNLTDNGSVEKVELWVDGSYTGIMDSDAPYAMDWDTEMYESGSTHTIRIRSIDIRGNYSDSAPITLIVFQTFQKIFGGSEADYCRSIQLTPDGGYILLGSTDSFGNGSSDVWLIKTDSKGNEEWSQTFGGSNRDLGFSVQLTTDGGYIIIGSTKSFGDGHEDSWLIKTDSNGNEEWNRTFGGGYLDRGYSVQQTADGGYIIIGPTVLFEDTYVIKAWLIKTDSEGNEEWNRIFSGSYQDFSGRFVLQTADSGYIITGEEFSSIYNLFVIKTNAQGNEEWRKVDYPERSRSGGFQQTSDGGYIICGSYGLAEYDDIDAWLMKIDSQGNEAWIQNFGGPGYDYSESVHQTTDGGYIMTGSYGFEDYTSDVWLIKTDSEGNQEWTQTFGGRSTDDGRSVQQTRDGGYIIAASTHSYGNGSSNLLLIKTDSEGNTVSYGE
ncbi:MAG: hypothetical protein GXO90_00930 [FCB group bacterium]|nr:hypothetical protein [FCB group bacterium]